MPLALIADRASIEWADIGLLAGLLFAYVAAGLVYPGLVLRPFFWVVTRTVYRIRTSGTEHVPATGPVLLLSNHVTYIDWLLIWSVSPRKLRFVAWAGWKQNRIFRWFFQYTNAILIDGNGGPRQLLKSLNQIAAALDAGEAVCMFPEGALSRGGGTMMPFHRGFERIVGAAKRPIPIVPVCLNQLWGSVFSYAKGKVFWKWPERVPYPVTIVFGPQIPSPATALGVRLAIQELAADVAIRESDRLLPVHRQFVRTAARFKNLRRIAWIDCSAGTPREFSYFKAIVGSTCVAGWLRSRIGPAKTVGLWMPTSAGSALANIALNFLGRTTANLNYTAGTDSLRSAVQQTGMTTVVTSKKFLARMPLVLEGITLIYMEDAAAGVTKWQRIRAAVAVAVLPGWAIDRFVLRLRSHSLDDIATVIFSSGSTGQPKGVRLSHRNIASNTSAAVVHLSIVAGDRFLGVLPFFHSFGYTLLLWLPVQAGGSAVYYPDPRQAKEVGELCKKYGCTGFLSTATFMRFYLRRCDKDDFHTLRLIVCGAEKLPASLACEFEEKFGVLPMEGYGCTELAPVVAANVADEDVAGIKQIRNKVGTVGHPLPGIASRTVDPDTDIPRSPGEDGMLQVKGPNLMPGYLGQPEQTAKVIRDGWYTTGDMARIDDDGFIIITGRLSRFAKIGGEMVPLEKVEEDMHAILGTADRVLAVSAIPDERKGERLIVLHLPALAMPPRDLNKKLSERGLPNLWIPGEREYFEVAEMPTLGSGKLDLKRVKELALEVAAKG